MTDQLIISRSELERLQRANKVGKVGWISFAVVTGALLYTFSLLHARIELQNDIAQQTARLEQLSTHFEELTESQRAQGELLISWGEFVKQRSILANQNLTTSPPYQKR